MEDPIEDPVQALHLAFGFTEMGFKGGLKVGAGRLLDHFFELLLLIRIQIA